MTDKNDSKMTNPAIQVEKLIRQLDQILGDAGVVQVNDAIALSKKGNNASVLDYLMATLEKMSFVKLQQNYQKVLGSLPKLSQMSKKSLISIT